MAKKDGSRTHFSLECTECEGVKVRNYRTSRNRHNTPEKIVLKKFCSRCRTHTDHKEVKG
ncbi:50S ribosomal protein L33 [bacterium]|nr:50S ribosomal protein L33 [bacterium]